jgi:hypothetical protein
MSEKFSGNLHQDKMKMIAKAALQKNGSVFHLNYFGIGNIVSIRRYVKKAKKYI